ncbi:MAG: acyl-CoA thioesterase [Chloroflexota bacterium]|nr:acyl-CoA thioesterase [Chloroflexota bacterium]
MTEPHSERAIQREAVPRAEATLAYQMLPEDANSQGFVHGGSVTKLADTAAGVCAARHARCRVATVLIKEMTFNAPVKIGALVTVHARLVGVGRTSMQIDVAVWAEEITSGERVLTSTGRFVFVAIGEDGRATPVPPMEPHDG